MLQAAATDGTIYERYDSDDVVVFELASALYMLEEFRETYGMRFVGLADQGSLVYQTYRVPDPEAPYPQDFVIDQDGHVRYWSWEYDPQEVMALIDRLVQFSGIQDPRSGEPGALRLLSAEPNPFRGDTTLRLRLSRPGALRAWVSDASGRNIRGLLDGYRSAGLQLLKWDGRDDRGLPAAGGVYYVNLSSGGRRVARRVVLLR
jgi:hypothetical protein